MLNHGFWEPSGELKKNKPVSLPLEIKADEAFG
jgi:hypothetical protein